MIISPLKKASAKNTGQNTRRKGNTLSRIRTKLNYSAIARGKVAAKNKGTAKQTERNRVGVVLNQELCVCVGMESIRPRGGQLFTVSN